MNNKIFNGPETFFYANVPWRDVLREDFHVIVYKDNYPVTEGHLLFVPKYNTLDVLNDALNELKEYCNVKNQNC